MPIYVSKTGLESLQKEAEALQTRLAELRKEKAIAYTESGDTWHDNPYFNSLEQEEGRLGKKIQEINGLLRDAQVINTHSRNTEVASLGSIVRIAIYDEKDGEKEEIFEIVGYNESDTKRRHLAYNSPLGKMLLGMTEGESRTLVLKGSKKEIELVSLHTDWE